MNLGGADVDRLVTEYLNLAERVKGIKEIQEQIKGYLRDEMEKREIKEIVSVQGHVRLMTRSASVRFPALHVLGLAKVWVASSDPILNQCGELLMSQRKDSQASTYVRISRPKGAVIDNE